MSLHRYLLPALLAPSLLLSTAAIATDNDLWLKGGDGVVGFLDSNDEHFDLEHAYAISDPRFRSAVRSDEQSEGNTRDSKTRLVVFLTEEPIPHAARGDIAKIHALVNRGELHGLELTFNSVARHPRWTGRLLLGGDNLNQVFRDRHGGTNVQLRNFETDGARVSGSIFLRNDIKRRDFDGDLTGDRAGFNATFGVEVDRGPAPTNTLNGRTAWKTPQADALVLAISALRKKDIDRFKQFVATNSEIASRVDEPNAEEFRDDMLKHLPTNPGQLRQSISKIVIYGDRAFLLTKAGGGGGREFILLRESGQWKLAQG